MASSSVPTVFPGNVCPKSVQFGRIHGSTAATCTIIYEPECENDGEESENQPAYVLPGEVSQSHPGQFSVSGAPVLNLGDAASIQIDKSEFNGFVAKKEITEPETTGVKVLKVTLVDWRDSLHDHIFFGGYNVQESNGVHWHMLPEDWEKQSKTFVSRELDQFDFDSEQDGSATVPNLIRTIGTKGLLSAATILNSICKYCVDKKYFTVLKWVADPVAEAVLKTSRPMNLDFTGGSTIASAIQQVLDLCNLRFTCTRKDELKITLKGQTNHTMIKAFMAGTKTLCDFNDEDLDEGSYGVELHDRGRYVTIVGERNLHQWTFPLRICWNKLWTHEFRYTPNLGAVLGDSQITALNLLEELPSKWHDKETWDHGQGMYAQGARDMKRQRTKMVLHDYINKIPYRSYVIDFGNVITDFSPNTTDPSAKYREFNLDEMKVIDEKEDKNIPGSGPNGGMMIPCDPKDFFKDYDVMDLPGVKNSPWPIGNRLVTESNAQAIVYATFKKIDFRSAHPIATQKYLIPVIDGFSLEEEEVIDDSTARMEHRVRVNFNDIRVIVDPKEITATDMSAQMEPKNWIPDKMFITITLQGKVFVFSKGNNKGVKVRTQKRQMKNLFQAFVDGVEKMILAQNFSLDLKDKGVQPAAKPIKAKDMATKMADQLLFSLTVANAGSLKFLDKAGYEPDGLIETVSVNWDDEKGITETLNFSSQFMEHQVYTPYLLRQSVKFQTEADRNREMNHEMLKALQVNKASFKQGIFDPQQLKQMYEAVTTGEILQKVFGGNGASGDTSQVKLDTKIPKSFDPRPFMPMIFKSAVKIAETIFSPPPATP
jgi:hypothetical protein